MSAYDIWTEKCPYCGAICEADFVDVGVGMVQCGPFHCDICYASQIGPYDDETKRPPNEVCKDGWYPPHSEPGSSANVLNGKVVTHRQMERAYKEEFTGNPLYELPGEVERWREKHRKGGTA